VLENNNWKQTRTFRKTNKQIQNTVR